MEDSLKLSFELLSEQYLNRTAKERKVAEEKQLSAINNALKQWAEKVKGGGQLADTAAPSFENDHLVAALSEAKERQGNIISVSTHHATHCQSHCWFSCALACVCPTSRKRKA